MTDDSKIQSCSRLNDRMCDDRHPTPELCVVDADQSTRDSLGQYLANVGCHVRCFMNGADCLDAMRDYQPDCIVTELVMNGMTGLQLCRELRNSGIHMPVVVVTEHGDVSSAVEAMKLGVIDYLEKPCGKEELLQAVNCGIMQARIMRELLDEEQGIQKRLAKLSAREREILNLISEGLVTKQIASRLGISSRTVDVHRSKLLHKLEIDSPSQLSRVLMFQYREKSFGCRNYWQPVSQCRPIDSEG